MSKKHIEKYPGLYAGCKAAGINYVNAYIRVRRGVSVADAIAAVVAFNARRNARRERKLSPAPTPPTAPRLFAWERPEWNAKARAEVHQRPVKPSMRHIRRIAEDTAPAHIQRVRTAYCDEFIRTGVLNPELGAKLREYATQARKNRNEVTYAKTSPAADTPDPAIVLGQST